MNQSPLEITVFRHFRAAPGSVFDAWLDPVSAARWFFASPQGEIVVAEIDPVEGGEFRFVDRRDDEDIEHIGEYEEIDRPRRLVFVFTVNQSELSRVAIDIAPAEGGGSALTLTHAIHPRFAAYADRSKKGWEVMLEGLAKVVDGRI